jgi:hypothetical protein
MYCVRTHLDQNCQHGLVYKFLRQGKFFYISRLAYPTPILSARESLAGSLIENSLFAGSNILKSLWMWVSNF